MNPSGVSLFNQARIEWAIRLKYSPMPALDMDILSGQLNAFRIGDFRQIGKTWEVMMERDGELAVNSDKRKSDAAGLEWQVVSDGSPDGDKHAAALQYFYENLTATEALDQDVTGGADELIYQVASALDYKYSIHEMLLRVDNAGAREVTAEFRHTPLWFFEARRGYLGYMPHIFDMYGIPCVQGEWLTAVNIGWMRPLAMAYAMKMFPLRDWLLFCTRYGSGFLDATTDAAVNTPEWNQAQDALNALANDGAVLHNAGVNFKFLEQSARNSLPFHPIVEMINGLYAKCYRGVDLATGSRGSSSDGGQSGKAPVGASVQKEESGIFLIKDAKWITGVLNERVDRPVIRYLFGQEPRAWFVLMPPLDDTSTQDLAALQGLVPMGFKVMLKEVYKRFRWSVPEAGEACLTPAAPASNGLPTTDDGPQTSDQDGDEDGDEDGGGRQSAATAQGGRPKGPQATQTPQTPQTPQAPKKPAATDATGEETDPLIKDDQDKPESPTAPARSDEDTPIGAGADPARNPGLATPGNPYYSQAESRQMPITMRRGMAGTPEVDAAAGWSEAGLQQPALGYSIPNQRLESLTKIGLGNSRAAQALRRSVRAPRAPLALANDGEPTPIVQLRSAHIDDLAPVRHALLAIENIQDDQLFLKKLRELVGDHGDLVKLLADINAYPKAAKVLNDLNTQAMAKALSRGPALANMAGEQPRDSLGKWVDENGGGLSEKDNIQRGQKAMDRAMRQKADVQKAMHRKGVGQIDFEWGTPGDKSQDYKGGKGISHIIEKHGEEVARNLPTVLGKGKITPHEYPDRRYIEHEGQQAILERKNSRSAFVVTSFKPRKNDY